MAKINEKPDFCLDCGTEMKKSFAVFEGTRIEALRCENCGRKIFSESQAIAALRKIHQQKLAPQYPRTPIKIGASWAVTFPKDVAERFGLSKKTKLKLRPQLHKGSIIIEKD